MRDRTLLLYIGNNILLLHWNLLCVIFDFFHMFCRAENMARKAAGEELLPEEDPLNPIFKPIPEPSRLDSFLITNQIANYAIKLTGMFHF